MGKASRDKGKRGERLLAQVAKEVGFGDARRGAPLQAAQGGADDAADVIHLGRIWGEMRWREQVRIGPWMREVLGKDRPGFIRVLFHKTNRGPLLATLEASELLKLERDALKYRPTIASALRADEENAS